MAIKKLISLIQERNIAETLKDDELRIIGSEVCKGFDVDWDSMEDWRKDIEEGRELIKPPQGSRSEPWEGAANFKTPILMEARLKFGDRATQELLKTNDLVSFDIVGKDSEEKEKRVERVTATMNWQLTTENESWVEEQDKLLYDVSTEGSLFKKSYFDPVLGHNVSEIIRFPYFAVHQESSTLADAPRFTHRLFYEDRRIASLKAAGVWKDVETTTNTEEGKLKTTEFYEQQAWLDLDEDGVSEPYVVTVHASTGNVLRIKAQFRLDDIILIDDDGVSVTLESLLKRDENDNVVFENEELVFTDDVERTVVHVKRDANLSHYPFIVNPCGEFLSVGYFHLLGAYCAGINSTSNALLDAGVLSNLQGGWLSREFRKQGGEVCVQPGRFQQTDIPAQDLQSSVRLYDLKEPSVALMTLNTQMNEEAKRLSSTTDLGAALGQNTPAATALSIIEEAQEANGAILLRIYRAMQKEFGIWFKLNSRFMDPQLYKRLTDDPDADAFTDFNTQDLDVMPSANPQASSKLQRMHRAQAQLNALEQIAATGGNPQPVVKEFLEAIGSEIVDEVYPELTPEQQQALAAEQERQKQLQQEEFMVNLEATKNIGDAQAMTAQSRLIDSQTKAYQAVKDVQKTEAEIGNIEADTYLKIEKAETESTKNATNIVHTELAIAKDKRENEERNDNRRPMGGVEG